MVNFYRKSKNDLYLNLQTRLEEIGIAYTSIDSISNILNEFITDEIVSLGEEFDRRVQGLNVSSATASELDELAYNMYGLTRRKKKKASSGLSLRFQNNSTTDVNIPAGTQVSSGSQFNTSGIVFEVVDALTVEANNVAFADVIASESGSSFNVEANVLTNHSLGNTDILCTNVYPILNGQDEEIDSSFRNRILRYMSNVSDYNSNYMTLRMLDVPGVLNTKLVQGYRGLGTMSVFVLGAGNRTDSEIIRIAQNRVNEIVSPGERVFVEKGVSVSFDIKMRLINNNNYSQTEIDDLKYLIRTLISQQFLIAKSQGTINFRTMESLIKERLRAEYNFIPSNTSNGSVFKYIKYEKTDPDATIGSSQYTLSENSMIYALAVNEIPKLNTIDIEVELVLWVVFMVKL